MEDVIALSVASRLRKLEVPARRIARILAAIRGHSPLRPRYLLTDGRTVFFRNDDGEVMDLLRTRQAAFALFLEPLYPEAAELA